MNEVKVALYARSSVRDHTVTQLRSLRVFAAARGWDGLSGANDHRSGLDAMLAAAREKKIAGILCTRSLSA